MSEELIQGIVRILGDRGEVVGTGFVVSESGLIATCSHVIQREELQNSDTSRPEKVRIIFQATGDEQDARVEPDWWLPWNDGDLAIIRAEGILPSGVRPLLLGSAEGTHGHEVCTFGFPYVGDDIQGLGGDGRVVRLLFRTGRSILQLRSSEITVGFSGAPVWDRLRRRVIGIVSDIAGPVHQRLVQTAFAISTETLLNICPVLHTSEVCPYRGLDAFREADAEFFFGCQQIVEGLLNRLRREPRFLTILGPSGSGKSSVVQAGFIPQLRDGKVPGSDRWGVIISRPADNPFDELARQGLSDGTQDLAERVRVWLHQHPEQERLVLVFDQFEELFVTCSEALRQSFVKQVTQLLHSPSPISVILVMRDDFYSRITQHEALVGWLEQSGGPIHVPQTLKQDELAAMVQKPAEAVGLRFEEGLVEMIVRDTMEASLEAEDGGQAGRRTVLPLLEFALRELWKRRQEGALTREAYSRIGSVAGALTQWADGAFFELESEEQQQLARRIFTDLIYLGDESQGILDSRRRRAQPSLCRNESEQQSVQRVVQQLVEHRLLVTDRDLQTNNEVVEIIHDALLRTWGRLKQWIEEDRDFLLWHQKMEGKVQEWVATDAYHPAKRDGYKLIGGRDLGLAKEWQAKRRADLSLFEQEFIEASAKRQRKTTNRLRILVGALSIFIVGVMVLGSLTRWALLQADLQLKATNFQTQIALSRALAAQSNYYLSQNRVDLALLLSVKAYQTNDNYDTRDRLLSALQYSPHMSTILRHDLHPVHTAPTNSLAFSTDGQTLISADDRYGDITVWDIAAKKQHSLSLPPGNGVSSMAVSPDGKLFASASPDGIWLWDIKKGAVIAQLEKVKLGREDSTKTLAFSPDGRYLASGDCGRYVPLPPNADYRSDYCAQGRILLWDVASRKLARPPLLDNTGQVCRLAFSRDGAHLASRSCDRNDSASNFIANDCTQGQVLLWDMTKDNPVGQLLTNTQDEVSDVEFSPDGHLLATGGGNGEILLWDAQSRQRLSQTLLGHTGHVCRMAFSADGKLLASGGTDRTVRLWNAETGKPIGEPFAGHQAEVMSIAFSPNGQQFASGDGDGAIILWNVGSYIGAGQPLVGMSEQATSNKIGYSSSEAFSPKGDVLAIGYQDGKIILRDVKTGNVIETLEGGTGNDANYAGESLAFSPDGRLLASGSYDYLDFGIESPSKNGKVLVWNVTTGKVIAEFKYANQQQTRITSLAFSPNGHVLVGYGEVSGRDSHGVATDPTTMVFWDVATGKIIHQITQHGLHISNVAFSPDGQRVASSNEDKITFWNVATGQPEGPILDAKVGAIDSVAFSPDGHTLATGNSNGTLILWNVSTRKPISRPLPLHQDATNEPDDTISVAFSSDGKIVATGDLANVILWDVTTYQRFVHPIQYANSVFDVVFSPDEPLLASVESNGFITLWDINLQSWLAHACNIANRNFTTDEWNQFVKGQPYQNVCSGLPQVYPQTKN